MKLIGLLGGMGWQSTVDYYRCLNELVHRRLGKNHSARIVLLSPDYEDIKQYGYDQIRERGDVLMSELLELASCNPDCILICNNTLHKAYDEIKAHLSIDIPVLHIVELVRRHLAKEKRKRVLLLGTQFTMEDGFFAEGLKKFGVASEIPPADDRRAIQAFHDTLLREPPDQEMKNWFRSLIGRYEGTVDAVVLACTELPLVIAQRDFSLPIVNTVELHCEAAVDVALS